MAKKNISLRTYMDTVYKTNPYQAVHEQLHDDKFVKEHGWFRVWHEGHGEGICSPKEKIVAVFDEDDLEECHDVYYYKYNPKAWVKTDWNKIYNGENGEGYEVKPI